MDKMGKMNKVLEEIKNIQILREFESVHKMEWTKKAWGEWILNKGRSIGVNYRMRRFDDYSGWGLGPVCCDTVLVKICFFNDYFCSCKYNRTNNGKCSHIDYSQKVKIVKSSFGDDVGESILDYLGLQIQPQREVVCQNIDIYSNVGYMFRSMFRDDDTITRKCVFSAGWVIAPSKVSGKVSGKVSEKMSGNYVCDECIPYIHHELYLEPYKNKCKNSMCYLSGLNIDSEGRYWCEKHSGLNTTPIGEMCACGSHATVVANSVYYCYSHIPKVQHAKI